MPMFDLLCDQCGGQHIDVLQALNTPPAVCPAIIGGMKCTGLLQHAWLSKPPAAVGDECDVTVRHGLCNPDGTPRRYTSKSDMAREAKARGLESYVVHRGTKDGDKSKFTTRWI